MARNTFRSRGPSKASRPDAGKANIYNTPVFGVVKDNVDPTRSGRLQVYIAEFGAADPDDADNWITVGYMSNFFGSIRPTSSNDDFGSFKRNPASYGEWHAPPDIDTTVICIFINGDINFGYYIGCVPDAETLHMVPAVAGTLYNQKENVVFNNSTESNSYGGALSLPVTNMNVNNDSLTNNSNFITSPKPIHSHTAAVMKQQGIIRDPVRGPITTSAQREAASRVGWGVSTPGRPIYEGGYDDDNISDAIKNITESELKKLRIISRRGGHSIIMDDGDVVGKDQLIRIRTAKGHQILMSDDGQTLMILHSNGQSYIELGKEGTVDIYSTNSINLRTQGDLNLHADNNINIHAEKELNMFSENTNITTKKSLQQSIGLNYAIQVQKLLTAKVLGAMAFQSKDNASFDSSSSTTYINGKIINLNSGKSPTKPATVTPLSTTDHTDTLYSEPNGFTAAPNTLKSITSRAPAHAPWADAGLGVDIKTNLSSSSKLPSKPKSLLSKTVKTGLGNGIAPVKIPTAISAPSVPSISKSLNTSSTAALLGATAQKAATGPLSSAISKGADVVSVGSDKVAAIGTYAQTPNQLAGSGVLKPGSDRLINSLVSSGSNITQSMPNTLFTGNYGIKDLNSYTKDIEIQTSSVVTNFQQAQTIMTSAGVITGSESSEQIAGVIFSTTTSGEAKTLSTVKTQINSTTDYSAVINDIGFATSSVIAASITLGGEGGLSQVVNAMIESSDKPIPTDTGLAGAAFSSINAAFPVFDSGKPVDLLASVNDQKKTADSLAGEPLTDVSPKSLLDTSSIASGMINIPGGINSISAFNNQSLSDSIKLPGSVQIKNSVNNAVSAALNGFAVTGITGGISKILSGASPGIVAGSLTAISSVKSLFGGKGGSKTSSVAVNTTNRTEIDNNLKSLLGDPSIPPLDFTSGVSPQAKGTAQAISEKAKEIGNLNDDLLRINQEISSFTRTEGAEIRIAETQALPGDTRLEKRKQDYNTRLRELTREKEQIQNQINQLKG
jgi:hypothetical protein